MMSIKKGFLKKLLECQVLQSHSVLAYLWNERTNEDQDMIFHRLDIHDIVGRFFQKFRQKIGTFFIQALVYDT
jgi:hypothetical protein